ncbi:MAG TPA: hypothetical protein VFI02_05570, partial [Armatimonadota bacterium]|nr:hypothetical protein [Armatimonadota bacterium]
MPRFTFPNGEFIDLAPGYDPEMLTALRNAHNEYGSLAAVKQWQQFDSLKSNPGFLQLPRLERHKIFNEFATNSPEFWGHMTPDRHRVYRDHIVEAEGASNQDAFSHWNSPIQYKDEIGKKTDGILAEFSHAFERSLPKVMGHISSGFTNIAAEAAEKASEGMTWAAENYLGPLTDLNRRHRAAAGVASDPTKPGKLDELATLAREMSSDASLGADTLAPAPKIDKWGKVHGWDSFAMYVARLAGEQAPVLGSMAMAGMIPGVGTAAAFATGMALETGSILEDLERQGLDPEKARGTAALYGILAGTLEALPVAAFLKRTPGVSQTFKQALTKRLINTIAQSGEEAVTEGLQTIVEQTAIDVTEAERGNLEAVSWMTPEGRRSLWDDAKEAMIAGGLMGGGMGVFSGDRRQAQKTPPPGPAAPGVPEVGQPAPGLGGLGIGPTDESFAAMPAGQRPDLPTADPLRPLTEQEMAFAEDEMYGQTPDVLTGYQAPVAATPEPFLTPEKPYRVVQPQDGVFAVHHLTPDGGEDARYGFLSREEADAFGRSLAQPKIEGPAVEPQGAPATEPVASAPPVVPMKGEPYQAAEPVPETTEGFTPLPPTVKGSGWAMVNGMPAFVENVKDGQAEVRTPAGETLTIPMVSQEGAPAVTVPTTDESFAYLRDVVGQETGLDILTAEGSSHVFNVIGREEQADMLEAQEMEGYEEGVAESERVRGLHEAAFPVNAYEYVSDVTGGPKTWRRIAELEDLPNRYKRDNRPGMPEKKFAKTIGDKAVKLQAAKRKLSKAKSEKAKKAAQREVDRLQKSLDKTKAEGVGTSSAPDVALEALIDVMHPTVPGQERSASARAAMDYGIHTLLEVGEMESMPPKKPTKKQLEKARESVPKQGHYYGGEAFVQQAPAKKSLEEMNDAELADIRVEDMPDAEVPFEATESAGRRYADAISESGAMSDYVHDLHKKDNRDAIETAVTDFEIEGVTQADLDLVKAEIKKSSQDLLKQKGH